MGMTNVVFVGAVGYGWFFFGSSNSLEEMDGRVGAIDGGVIDGIRTSCWCRQIQTKVSFFGCPFKLVPINGWQR